MFTPIEEEAMAALKVRQSTKILAAILCVLIAGEANWALAGQETPLSRYGNAKREYLDGDFKAAKSNCEAIVAAVDENKPENRSFLGHSYLLLAASEERLNELGTARRHYRKASELLGSEPAVVEGVALIGLALYAERFATAQGADMLLDQFNDAQGAYSRERFEEARLILERLIADLEGIESRDTLKGQTCLLAGATYEKLKLRELSIKSYCRAKAVLGVGKTFEGLDLRKLSWYDEPCPGGAGGAVEVSRGRGSIGRFLGTILGLGFLAGLVWYLFFSKNAPFKKKTDSDATTYTSACYSTFWKFSVAAEWSGGSGAVTLSPDVNAGNYPKPGQNNGWEDQTTYTLSASGGGTLTSLSLTIDLEIGGGDNAKRQDIVAVDGAEKLNVTTSFPESCSAPGKKTYASLYSRGSTGTFTLKHKVVLSKSAAVGAAGELVRK
jgi:hypothetical protein